MTLGRGCFILQEAAACFTFVRRTLVLQFPDSVLCSRISDTCAGSSSHLSGSSPLLVSCSCCSENHARYCPPTALLLALTCHSWGGRSELLLFLDNLLHPPPPSSSLTLSFSFCHSVFSHSFHLSCCIFLPLSFSALLFFFLYLFLSSFPYLCLSLSSFSPSVSCRLDCLFVYLLC